MNANKASKAISMIQILVSSALTILIIAGLFLAYGTGGRYVGLLLSNIFPEMTIILGTLIPVLILRIKHRSQVAEGYLLPLFLLLVSLQTARMLPVIVAYTPLTALSMTWITIFERFFFMGSFTVLLYAAIQNMKNVNTSRTGLNVVFSLVAVFVISYITPVSGTGAVNYHEYVFNFLVFLILMAGVTTYLVNFISSRESYHLKRFFTFFFISIGDFMIITGDQNLIVSCTGTCFFIIGAAMLSAVSPKGY